MSTLAVPRIDRLRAERITPHTIQLQINRMQERYVVFYEGDDDPSFYRNKIRCKTEYKEYHQFICNGKQPVLTLLKELTFKECLTGLFFIDKDFDDYLGIAHPRADNLFVTCGYSMENYLVTKDVIKCLLNDYTYKNTDQNHHNIIDKFTKAYQDFLNFIKPIMAQVIMHRRSGNEFSFSDIEAYFKKCFCITDDLDFQKLDDAYEKNLLEQIKILNNPPIDLPDTDSDKWIRGKFALLFLYKFCQKLETKLKVKNPTTQKPRSDNGDGSMAHFIETISNKMIFPDLNTFLGQHIQ
ncbi:MAG: hypothetical protein ACJARD_001035 [Alphaproteobacteria bacterium]|jgi:hypothetical protein